MAPPKPPRRHWLQFSLRSLLLLMLVVSVLLGWKVNRVRRQREAVAVVTSERLQGRVRWDYEFDGGGSRTDGEPPGPYWLRQWLGDDLFAHVVWVDILSIAATDADLAHLESFPKLRRLCLAGSDKVTDAGLAHLRGLSKLKILILGGSQISDAGLLHVAKMKNLTRVWLRDTQVSDEGVEKLQQALPNCTIKRD